MILYPTDDETAEIIYANYVLTCKRQIEGRTTMYTDTINRMIKNVDKIRNLNETVLG
jgi:hypothetical protein